MKKISKNSIFGGYVCSGYGIHYAVGGNIKYICCCVELQYGTFFCGLVGSVRP